MTALRRVLRLMFWLLIWPLFIAAYLFGAIIEAPYHAHCDWLKGWRYMLTVRRPQ